MRNPRQNALRFGCWVTRRLAVTFNGVRADIQNGTLWEMRSLSCGGQFRVQNGDLHFVREWDLLIAHPPCTYLSNAGARWLYAGGELNTERYRKGLDGKKFFMAMLNADCSRIAVENPIPSSIYDLPQYTQIIQPYQFGEPWSKKTCLWLKGLEPLQPTNIVEDYKPYCSSGSYSGTHNPKYKGASRKGGSAKSRSKTFPGIAKAMASQWSDI